MLPMLPLSIDGGTEMPIVDQLLVIIASSMTSVHSSVAFPQGGDNTPGDAGIVDEAPVPVLDIPTTTPQVTRRSAAAAAAAVAAGRRLLRERGSCHSGKRPRAAGAQLERSLS